MDRVRHREDKQAANEVLLKAALDNTADKHTQSSQPTLRPRQGSLYKNVAMNLLF